MVRGRRIFPALLLALSLPGAAAAEWQLTGGVGGDLFRLREEASDGSRLVAEDGALARLRVAAEASGERWLAALAGELAGGTVDYDGQSQVGTPVGSTSDYREWRLDGILGRRFTDSRLTAVYGRLGYQRRERTIHGSTVATGLEERYDTVWLGVGSRIRLGETTALRAEFACAASSSVSVAFDAGYDDARLDIDDHCRASLRLRWRLGSSTYGTLYLEPHLEYEALPRTSARTLTRDGTPVGRVRLPETEIVRAGLLLVIAFAG